VGRNRPDADVLQLVFDWLCNGRNGKWLLVLDSADDSDVLVHSTSGDNDDGLKLVEYLPQSPNGSILITTRNKYLAFRLTGTHQAIHEIGPMTKEEALMLLKKRLGTLSDANAAADLVRSLDLIPLAISQAAAYIQMRAPRTSLVRYLNEFRQSKSKRVKLLSHNAGGLRRDLRQHGGASNAILTTWQLSFDHIRSRRPSAADLLSFMSFFNRQGIPESLLRSPNNNNNAAQSISPEDTIDSDSHGSDDETENEFEDDVAMLRDYSLIMLSEDANVFEMHGLVQLAMRRWLKAQGLQDKFLEQYITVMASSFPTGNYENWTVCRALFAHVEAAAEYRPNGDNLKKTWSGLLHNGGWYEWLQGRYAVAEQMVSQGRRTREKLLGKDHEATLASMSLLSLTYLNQGRWAEAEKLGVQVMETRMAKLGADHPDTLRSMSNLALTYYNQGRWEEAHKLFMQVMETRKAKLVEDHPDTLRSMSNLALTYMKQGRWEEAERLQMHVLKIWKTKLGEDHPDTLTSMNNLASTYCDQGRWEEAHKLFMQVMETRKAKLGEDHPDTLRSMNNLALTYRNQGRWEEAEKLQVQVMEARKAKLGADHPDTVTSMNNLASTYCDQGRWEEAHKLFMQVMETRKAKLEEDHPDTLRSMNNLASTYMYHGRWEEAEKLEAQVMETRKAKLGEDHPDTLTSMSNLALTWKSQGRHEEALSIMESCVQRQRQVLGLSHPLTNLSLSTLDKWTNN
jgi:tetratricopeptide (TPR) repeat protein